MTLVVPMFLIGAGISLGTGVQALVVGLTRRAVGLHVVCGVLCFFLSGVLYFTGAYYSAGTLEAVGTALKWQGISSLLAFPAFFLFVSAYTGQEKPHGLPIVLAFYATLTVVALTMPYGLRYATLVREPPIQLPWGEQLPIYSGAATPWGFVLRGATLLLFAWAFWRVSVLYRAGHRRRALMLGSFFVLHIGTIVWGILIDFGTIRSFYVAPLAFLTLVMLMSVSMAIDLRRQTDQIVRSAAEWKETFDNVRTPILVTDASGRIVRGNRAACETAGREQISGVTIGELGEGEPWQTATQLVAHIAAHGATSAEAKDVRGRTWDINIAHFSSDADSVERFILVIWDITSIVELQESVRRNERMSAMGVIVAGVAHEVRNPLFGISATLDAYAEELNQPAYRECAESLRSEVARLKLVMQDLLEYGKPPALAIEQTTVADVIDNAITGRGTRELPVQIVSNISSTLPPLLMDKARMRQVFQNLIDNAAQHSPADGVVRIDAQTIEHAGRQWIECSVADSGPGFSEEDLERLWEPFYTRREGGTGLGLPLVQRIVEEHDGSIVAANGPAGGATISVRLPIAEGR